MDIQLTIACTACSRAARPGRLLCVVCADRKAVYQRVKCGLEKCYQCDAIAQYTRSGKPVCPTHKRAGVPAPLTSRQRTQIQNLKQMARGLCVNCTKPRHPDSRRFCGAHLLAQRAYVQASHRRHRSPTNRADIIAELYPTHILAA